MRIAIVRLTSLGEYHLLHGLAAVGADQDPGAVRHVVDHGEGALYPWTLWYPPSAQEPPSFSPCLKRR